MDKIRTILLSLITVALIVMTIFLGMLKIGTPERQVGGTYFIGQRDFPDGISVDDTVVIDGNGNVDAPITSTNGSFSGTLSVTGATTLLSTLSVTGNATFSGAITQGTVLKGWIEGTCDDASTTIFSVVNPRSADLVVDFFYINITNGTSSAEFTIGTTTAANIATGLSSDPSDLLIDDLSVASSTAGTATTTAYAYNTSGTVSETSGFSDPGTNSENKILWHSGEYIAGYADTVYPGALTEATNMFECTYRIHYYDID